jgi:NADPH-dependent glutamate synthase beta subunit-like oxidoreductase
LRIARDQCGNVNVGTESRHTSIAKVFSCGDTRRSQSLVAWVIREKPPHRARDRQSSSRLRPTRRGERSKNERSTRATKLKH